MQFKKILVPVCGAAADLEAIKLACKLAKPVKGKIYVTYVIEVQRAFPLDAEVETDVRKAEDVLTQAEKVAEEQDYEVETDLLQAREVGPALVDEAIEREVDLILIGCSYKKKFGEFSMGSTIPYVLKNAPCRVVVCREPMPQD